jgi:hypothetical protein
MLTRQQCSTANPCQGAGSDISGCISNLKSVGIGTHKFIPEAADAFLKMKEDMPEDTRNKISIGSSFRDAKTQCNIFDWDHFEATGKRRKKGTSGVAVAPPGSSNHGWGRALDISPKEVQDWIRENGSQYGWCWGEVESEPWHFTFCGDGPNKWRGCNKICKGRIKYKSPTGTSSTSSTSTEPTTDQQPQPGNMDSLGGFFKTMFQNLKGSGIGQKQIQEITEDVDRISEIIKKVL